MERKSSNFEGASSLLQKLDSPSINWQRDTEYLNNLYNQFPQETIDTAHFMLWPLTNDVDAQVDTGPNQATT